MTLAMIGALLVVAQAVTPPAQDGTSRPNAEKRTKPTQDEPMAPAFSLKAAADHLDKMAVGWTRKHHCGSCHSNYPFLMARPSLKEYDSSAAGEVRAFLENRVAHWDDAEAEAKPKWDAEVVSTAEALAINDAVTTGALHPLSRKALDRMWTLQKPNGGWEWLKCGWPPLEHDDYYGAIVAALAAGHAPDDYARGQSARDGLDRLCAYFRKTPAPDLHHQTMLLWASTRLDGLMDPEQKAATLRAVRALQRGDGGWCLPSLGHWKRRDGSPNDPASPSDGYATGLVVFVLREAGVPASDPALQRGIAWLKANQRASGRWFTRSLNDDQDHYIADAGTCYAVMALRRCEPASHPAERRTGLSRQSGSGRRIIPVVLTQVAQSQPRSLRGWGDVIDPDRDCKMALVAGKLTITVPGTLHDLGAEVGKLNAPAVLGDVNGDFVATVKVGGKVEPRGNCTRPGGYPYHGTGLLLWNDPGNYVRLERAAVLREGKLLPYVNFEERTKSRPTGGGVAIPNAPVYLRLVRAGNKLAASVSTDGKVWRELKTLTIDYPAKLKVGVAAVNSADVPFTAELEEYRLVPGSDSHRT